MWLKRLSAAVRPPSLLEDLFSFAFHAWCVGVYAGEKEQQGELCRPGTLAVTPVSSDLYSSGDRHKSSRLLCVPVCPLGEHVTSWFKNEVERMGFDTQNAWRISDINSKFRYEQPTAP